MTETFDCERCDEPYGPDEGCAHARYLCDACRISGCRDCADEERAERHADILNEWRQG